MDFLEIRKKAKERARAQAGADRAEPPAPADAGGSKDPSPPPGRERPRARRGARRDPAATAVPAARPPAGRRAADGPEPAEVGVAELLRGLPAAGDEPGEEGSAPAVDERFTTWRPGDGAPPFVLPPPVLGPRAPPHEDDFKVITPGAGPPAAPPSPSPAAAARSPLDPLDEFFYRPGEEAPELPQLADPVEAPRAEPAGAAREEYLTFLLGGEEYAVAIGLVREVIRSPPVTEVPRAPAHVLGVVTVRGEIVTVVDPRRRLGLPPGGPAEGERKIVIVDPGDGPCGLVVDRVAHVVRLAPGRIEPCPQGLAGHGSDCLTGIGREGERIFTVLELGALLRRGAGRAGEGAGGARRPDAAP